MIEKIKAKFTSTGSDGSTKKKKNFPKTPPGNPLKRGVLCDSPKAITNKRPGKYD